ncbi:MAG: helix-turn-helix domain-containing protein [Candidatus Merdivicinus sp.]|jgi:transcriptional regulator with XRE-family HTH domain
MVELGNKIRELRLKRSTTQEELARQLNVSAQCVSKWENNVTMPDIQLLPELSVYFGVTIDELFDLTEDAHLDRISHMLENKQMLEESEFHSAEEFLRERADRNPDCGDYFTLLAELYNHMADGFRRKAEYCAEIAIQLDPDKKWNHSLLRMAQQGSILDWNFSNHSKRIAFYQNFVKEHPHNERGYISLIQELITDNRLEEAETILTEMRKDSDAVRISPFWGMIQWKKGDHITARKIWQEMLEQNPSDWLAYACAADCMAQIGCYNEAIPYYRRSMELQTKPRYTDSAISIAQIYEIQGKYEEAMEAWKKVIEILQEEHGIREGESLDAPRREIERLKRL